MTRQRQRASTGEIVSHYATEEAIYLKVSIDDVDGHFLGWARGVRVDRDTLKRWLQRIDDRLNDALQEVLPWEGQDDPPEVGRWEPPKP